MWQEVCESLNCETYKKYVVAAQLGAHAHLKLSVADKNLMSNIGPLKVIAYCVLLYEITFFDE